MAKGESTEGKKKTVWHLGIYFSVSFGGLCVGLPLCTIERSQVWKSLSCRGPEDALVALANSCSASPLFENPFLQVDA